MLRIEDKLDQTRTTLQTLRKQVDQALAGVPAALSLGENLNVQPVKLPLFVNAQLGFAAVYLLADYDDIARKLILAHHTALIDRSTLERWLNEGRTRCAACSRWPSSTATRAAPATISRRRMPQRGSRWRSSASCRRTSSKARAARRLRHPWCAVVCNSAVRILPQPLPASMVMRPLLPTVRRRSHCRRGRIRMSDLNQPTRYFRGLQQEPSCAWNTRPL